MNKIISKITLAIFAVIVAVGLFGFVNRSFAQAQTSESISDYKVDINIRQDSSVDITETISYDFGNLERHGIFRNIPYKYKDRGGTFKLRISDVAVKNNTDEPVPFDRSTSDGDVVLKIGDPDATVTGRQIYKISYKVERAINYFDDHDELYWNAIGLGWNVPIMKGEAVVKAPTAIFKMACYTGPAGSTAKNCIISGGNTDTVTFTTTSALQPDEAFTIVVGVPPNTLAKPTIAQQILDIVRDNGILALPLVVLALMFYFWNRYGKDPKRKNAIVAQYDAPDKMSALYMGTLLHNRATNKDIAAEVIYLAANGYLTIQQIETGRLLWKGKDYQFTKTDKDASSLAPQTKALLDELFAGDQAVATLSELKKDMSFGRALVKLKSRTLKELVNDKYFRANPSMVRGVWLALGIIVAVGLSILLGNLIGYLGVFAAGASGLIIIGFSFIMPARTQKGTDAVAHIRGLEEYLTVAEKDRLKFHNAPEKNPQLFEALLPFAIALGVETAWAEQFKGLTQAPSWYTDASGQPFNAAVFSNSVNSFSDSMQSVSRAVTTASSGGSGFSGGGSGGGGGGGGGGSW